MSDMFEITLACDGFNAETDRLFAASGNTVYYQSRNQMRRATVAIGSLRIDHSFDFNGFNPAADRLFAASGSIVYYQSGNQLRRATVAGGNLQIDHSFDFNGFNPATDRLFAASGNTVYYQSGNQLRRATVAGGNLQIDHSFDFNGFNPATDRLFAASGNTVYYQSGNQMRRATVAGGNVQIDHSFDFNGFNAAADTLFAASGDDVYWQSGASLRRRGPQRIGQYIDSATGVVRRPYPDDAYGDCVWRSSWLYASVLILRAKEPAVYAFLQLHHDLDATLAGTFLSYFRDHGTGPDGWNVPGSTQDFSRDQLSPLLYLLACVSAFAPEYKDVGKDILLSLNNLEAHGTPLSPSSAGTIDRGLGYVIDVLADHDRYNFNFKTTDLQAFLITHAGDEDAAQADMRSVYKKAFGLSLDIQRLGELIGADDEYSVFNALALVSLQCVAWGPNDDDVKAWRSNFNHPATDRWGPAFRIVAGATVSTTDIDAYASSYTCRANDNDIIMGQRPSKIIDGTFPASIACDNRDAAHKRWLVLDGVILRALVALWAG